MTNNHDDDAIELSDTLSEGRLQDLAAEPTETHPPAANAAAQDEEASQGDIVPQDNDASEDEITPLPVPRDPIIGEIDTSNVLPGKRTRTKMIRYVVEQGQAAPVSKTKENFRSKQRAKAAAASRREKKGAPDDSFSESESEHEPPPKKRGGPPKTRSNDRQNNTQQDADEDTITPRRMREDIASLVTHTLDVAENFARFADRYRELDVEADAMDEDIDDILAERVTKWKAEKQKGRK